MENQESQEIENKKRFLKRYRKTMKCVDRLKNKLAFLEDRMTSIKSPNLSGMPRGGTPVTIADLISDKDDLIERIDRLERKAKQIKAEILSEIDALDDDRYCDVLEAYFIDRHSLEDVAEIMGYSERHTYTLYKEAIAELIKLSL